MRIAICDTAVHGNANHISFCLHQMEEIAKEMDFPLTVDRYEDSAKLLFHLEDANKKPDVLLLDVRMPANQENGIEVAKWIRERQLDIEMIFLTEDETHWPEAFDVEALHYLVRRSTSEHKIRQVFTRAAQRILKRADEYVTFDCAGDVLTLRIRDIRYFSVDRHVSTVHYGNGKTFEFYTPLGRLENSLFNKDMGFVRTHNSYLVSLRYVHLCSSTGGITMMDGTKLPISRYRFAEVKRRFADKKELKSK